MKILLDENLPAKLKYDFGEDFEISTFRDMAWLGKKNGELFSLAVYNGFEIFITLDRNLRHHLISKSLRQFIMSWEVGCTLPPRGRSG
jgi:predicted nuclease of predicted toxin-antitoxin system